MSLKINYFTAMILFAIIIDINFARADELIRGQAEFNGCISCHSLDGSISKAPSLRGIIGRKSGSLKGFRYSNAMRRANIIWDLDTMNMYLEDPQKFIPGNIMPFPGINDSSARANLLQYLNSLN